MRLLHVLLVLQLVLLASSKTHATANITKITSPSGTAKRERLQRAAKSADNDPLHVENSEERGVFSSIKSKVANWSKMKYWVNAEKSDEYVKKKLSGFDEYKTLKKFWYQLEGRQLDKWFDEGVTMHGAWTRLGLDRIREDQVMQTSAYKTYVRYVKKYDSKVYGN